MNSLKEGLSRFYDLNFEREAAFRELSEERDRAIKLAKERSLFGWFAFTSLTLTLPFFSAVHYFKNKLFLAPIIPIIMVTGYHYENCFGDNLNSIKSTAENIMLREEHLIKPVGGTVTLHEIDKRVKQKSMTYVK
uniref:Plasminogen receptor (KT) n=1 Tax=Strongyloides papillosus TaxID=174720 RepID=A0A0N5C199_STREA